jgi:outer membrane protein assembly factor BamD
MKRLVILLAAVVLPAIAGCALMGDKQQERPAKELIRDGVAAFDDGKYHESLKHFEQLKDWYPFSKYAILAELKIGDANYRLQNYAEAIAAYEEFEQLHPRNEAIDYVIYQMGRCYYEQIDTIDRDQTAAKKAVEIFQRLAQSYPESAYTLQSRSHVINCFKKLAGHEFYVAAFYYKNKRTKAALERFRAVVGKYPDVGYHFKALRYIALCEARIAAEKTAQAPPVSGQPADVAQ